jgi:chemotaxis protein methyltransferase WspC
MSRAESPGSESLARIESVLRHRIGLDPTTVGSSLVRRAAERRMEALGIASWIAYAGALDHSEQELQALVEEVVVPETYFFREPEAITEIARRALAARELPYRVLSAPCSTGEEPYSIAMAFLMAGVPAAAIAIDAIDVSLEAVRRAREGVFRGGAFRGDTAGWRKYFREAASGWELEQSVRSLVTIAHGNVMDDGFRPPRDRYDAIFCRNLLIYFDVDAQARALEALARLLAPDGVLVVGAADTFAVRRAGFAPVAGAEHSFLFTRCEGSESAVQLPTPKRRARPRPVLRQAPPPPRRERAAAPRVQPAPAAPAPEASLIAEVARLAGAGLLAEAVRLGETALRGRTLSAELLALMGTTYAALPDLARAEGCYRRALFLDPEHEDALFHFALLLDQRGAGASARRLRARAKRAHGADAGAPS